MDSDHVERILAQWEAQRPDLDCSAMAVIGRLNRSSRLIEKRLLPVFKQHGISAIEFDILATLRRSAAPVTPTDLYQALMLTSGTMSTRLEKLVQDGYIQRTHADKDRRRCHVSLTQVGMTLIDKALDAHVDNQQQILQPLNSDEQKQLAHLLQRWLLTNE
ncbi:MarR family transcriptional regulator [Vibrio profundum]|uniref:MarR family winged helix-turn-helix transcriptional regulator n=1 Tax=Vibrio profundum TaxID=2910247 RepID=UPI003D117445